MAEGLARLSQMLGASPPRRPRRSGKDQSGRSRAFYVLLAFLVLVFLMGGSARKDIPGLVMLRPISVLVAVYALATAKAEHWRTYRVPIAMLAAILSLAILHLVPLPPGLWQALPGRSIILDIETMAGQPDIWFPLAMVPENAWNALYALATPIAAFFLAIQLSDRDHFWLLVSLVGLGLLSAFVGILQAVGINLELYAIMSDTPPGLFANRNHQATLLAMMFPMLALLAATGSQYGLDRNAARIVAAALAILLVPLVLVTGSRTGLVVCAIALLVIWPMRLELLPANRGAKPHTARLVIAGAVVAIIVAIGLAAAITSRNAAVSRLSVVDEDLRFSVWEQIWAFLPNYLPWGSGNGSYVEVYQIHEPASMLISSYSNHAHNDWLEVVMTAGVPGIALLIAAVGLFLAGVLASFSARGVAGKQRRLGLVMILVLAIASLVDYPLRTPIMAAIFAVATVWACRPVNGTREIKGRSANVG